MLALLMTRCGDRDSPVAVTGKKTWWIAAVAGFAYAALWAGHAWNWSWVASADDAGLRVFYGYGASHPGWVSFWKGVSALLGPNALRVVAFLGILTALVCRNARTAAFLALSLMGMGLVTWGAKALSQRPRPSTALAVERSTAFPSGHALGIMVAVLVAATVFLPALSGRARTAAIALGVALVVVGGLARVVLNVHHPTDVLAGWALGYLWFVLCVVLTSPVTVGRRPDSGRRSGGSPPACRRPPW